jgi:predicted tellurium resistance membrane protein TerC
MEWLFDPQIWLALVSLTALEIVLGIDNIIFIAVLAQRLPPEQQSKGRRIGLAMAMITRILLLFCLTLIMNLTSPLFNVFTQGISGRDIILIAGGLFLLGKSTVEIHAALEGEEETGGNGGRITASFFSVVAQIMILDIVFSLDSVITAIGLTHHLPIMVAAIVIAVLFMIYLADSVSAFIETHPTIKILALSFLLLVGVALIGEGLDLHIPKGYIYFAMAFSVFVEMLNLKLRKRMAAPVKLRKQAPDAKKPEN